MKKYYVAMDGFESGLIEVASEDGDYYRTEDVDCLLAQIGLSARQALAAESPTARKQAIQEIIDALAK